MSLTALLNADDDSICDFSQFQPSFQRLESNPAPFAPILSTSNEENRDFDTILSSNTYDKQPFGFNRPLLDSTELSPEQLDELDRLMCEMPEFQQTNSPSSNDQSPSSSPNLLVPESPSPLSNVTSRPFSPSHLDSPLAEQSQPLSTTLGSAENTVSVGVADKLLGGIDALATLVETPTSTPLHVLSHAQQNPCIPSQQPRERQRLQLTEAEKASRGLATRVAQESRRKALAEVLQARKEFEEKVAVIANNYHLNTKRLLRIVDASSHMKEKKSPSDYNVLLHHKSKEVNGNLQCGEKARPKELHALLAADTKLLAIAEDEEKMEQLRQEVIEHRALKARGGVSNLSAAHNIKATHEKLVQEFNNLHLHTGAVGFFFISRGHKDCIGIPGWGMAGQHTDKFMWNLLDKEPWDVLGLLEMWAVSRDSKDQITGSKELCKECTTLIASKLRFITRKQNMNMNYDNYEEAIVHKHSVKLAGWPSSVNVGQVIKPAKLSASQLPDLHKALRLDTCHWVSLNEQEVTLEKEAFSHRVMTGEATHAERRERRDAGTRQGKRTRNTRNEGDEGLRARKRARAKGKGKASTYKSSKFVDNDSDDDEQSSDSDVDSN